jgi:hypothetical protein
MRPEAYAKLDMITWEAGMIQDITRRHHATDILVVDDSLYSLDDIEQHITSSGFTLNFRIAQSLSEAITLLNDETLLNNDQELIP